jgi:hypothetical protein
MCSIELSTARQTCRIRATVASTYPVIHEAVDVMALRSREREPRHDPPCLGWIAVSIAALSRSRSGSGCCS